MRYIPTFTLEYEWILRRAPKPFTFKLEGCARDTEADAIEAGKEWIKKVSKIQTCGWTAFIGPTGDTLINEHVTGNKVKYYDLKAEAYYE